MAKPIVFTNHALVAMAQRQLAPEWIVRSIEAPQWLEPDPADPEVRRAFVSVPERGGRYLRVAYVETASEIRILSAFLDRRARPK